MDVRILAPAIGLIAVLAITVTVLAFVAFAPTGWRVISGPITSVDSADPGSLVHDVGKVPIIADFGDKIVYTTDGSLDPAPFEQDCAERGGFFNTCGTMCAPEAEVCADVCAYTCDTDTVSYFKAQMWEGAVERVGQPIEGFEPFMFMEAFPGLVAEDFDRVEALLGVYSVVDGEIVFTEMRGEVIHTAARAVSDEGMGTLLENIGDRLGIEITDHTSVDSVLEEIGSI